MAGVDQRRSNTKEPGEMSFPEEQLRLDAAEVEVTHVAPLVLIIAGLNLF